jgi:hypothetical protein
VLRGAGGVAVGLPFLEALASRRAWAAPPKRLAIVFQCNGVNMERWFPKAYGAITPANLMGTALEPLSSLSAKLLVPRGIAMTPRGYGLDPSPGCDHVRGTSCKLTARAIVASTGLPAGPSFDVPMAKRLNPGGRSPLNLRVGGGGSGGTASAFFTESGQRAPMIRNPWDAYRDWMGSGAPATGPATVDLVALRRQSVLDLVKQDLASLQAGSYLGRADRAKLDQHLQAIRELEVGALSGAGGAAVAGCSLPGDLTRQIQVNDTTYEKAAPLMMEIMGIAMACDHNRVTTCQFGTGAGGPIYKWCGDALNQLYNHHKLSHGATSDAATSPNLPTAEWKLALFNIDVWHMKMLKVLLDRLNAYTEPGGTVLDNAVVLYMNELSNGQQHNYVDLPVLIAGGAGGYLKQGQYVKLTAGSTTSSTECPTNQLYVTIANALGYRDASGAPMTQFGAPPNTKTGELALMRA